MSMFPPIHQSDHICRPCFTIYFTLYNRGCCCWCFCHKKRTHTHRKVWMRTRLYYCKTTKTKNKKKRSTAVDLSVISTSKRERRVRERTTEQTNLIESIGMGGWMGSSYVNHQHRHQHHWQQRGQSKDWRRDGDGVPHTAGVNSNWLDQIDQIITIIFVCLCVCDQHSIADLIETRLNESPFIKSHNSKVSNLYDV